jgi:hypothetical protein
MVASVTSKGAWQKTLEGVATTASNPAIIAATVTQRNGLMLDAPVRLR